MIHVIISAWRAAAFLPVCLASLRMQTYQDWRALITIDEAITEDYDAVWGALDNPCSDPRFAEPLFVEGRRFILENTVNAIRRSQAAATDIIAILDGDDWLARADALELVARAHQAGAWVTYGSWVANKQGYRQSTGAYPAGTEVRQEPWRATALRSFRRGLFDRVKEEDLRDGGGGFYTCCPDLALMFPALEMAGLDRSAFVPEPIYFYNRASGAAVGDTRRKAQDKAASELRARPKYDRLVAL